MGCISQTLDPNRSPAGLSQCEAYELDDDEGIKVQRVGGAKVGGLTTIQRPLLRVNPVAEAEKLDSYDPGGTCRQTAS